MLAGIGQLDYVFYVAIAHARSIGKSNGVLKLLGYFAENCGKASEMIRVDNERDFEGASL